MPLKVAGCIIQTENFSFNASAGTINTTDKSGCYSEKILFF
jgi:hypothetical protein